MKRNPIRAFLCLSLLLALLFSLSPALAQTISLDFPLLPQDTIAVVLTPEDADQPRIIYAIHGITKDEDTVSVKVMQIPADPQWKIYDADTDGVTEQEIRWVYGFPDDLPILGSYCEAYLVNGQDDWIYCKQDSSIPYGNQMDEQFTFLLSEITGEDQKTILQLVYGSIPTPEAIQASSLCLMTIDLSAHLNKLH